MSELIPFLNQNPWVKWIVLFLIAVIVWKIVKSVVKVAITTVIIIVIYLFIANVFVPQLMTAEVLSETKYPLQSMCPEDSVSSL